jgi:Xaa-Pro aminopeptidase
MADARLAEISLPDFGMSETAPEIPAAIHHDRLERLRARADEQGYDHLIVYADREHSANLSYLTGFDPRFEEAMLVVGTSGEPAILVGNECFGMARAAPLPMRRHLFQDFSLPGQPRDRSQGLAEILAAEGIRDHSRVGVIGWKEFADRGRIEVPAYIVDQLRTLTRGAIENAGWLLTAAADGLRVINEVEQLAAFEHASCSTSNGIRRLLFGLEPGMRERDAVGLLDWNGMPLSCHLMLSSGERASIGLLSPSDRRIERGDRFTVAFGIWAR